MLQMALPVIQNQIINIDQVSDHVVRHRKFKKCEIHNNTGKAGVFYKCLFEDCKFNCELQGTVVNECDVKTSNIGENVEIRNSSLTECIISEANDNIRSSVLQIRCEIKKPVKITSKLAPEFVWPKCEPTDDETRQCKICYVNEVNVCFKCLHPFCAECLKGILDDPEVPIKVCPKCRAPFGKVKHYYFP